MLICYVPEHVSGKGDMAQAETFQWHPEARVFFGAEERLRSGLPNPDATGAVIPVGRGPAALDTLLSKIVSGAPFCVAPSTFGTQLTAQAGRFFTLTSGSTGAAKVITRSQASWLRSFQVNAGLFDYTGTDKLAVLGSLEHSLALYGVIEAVHLGLTAYDLGHVRPDRQADLIAANGITVLYATPTQLRLLSGHPAMPFVRLILCGGGRLDPTTRDIVTDTFPNATLRNFYGAAETSFITISDDTTPHGSVGKAYPGVEIDIRDGDIWVRSPYLFDCYAEARSDHTQWAEDWLTVGEYGWLDEDGHLFLHGRAGRMVTVADKNLFLDSLEEALKTLPRIRDCAMVALPDPKRGQALHLFVEGEAPREAIALLSRTRFGPHAVPSRITTLDALPRLPSGKPDLVKLSELERV